MNSIIKTLKSLDLFNNIDFEIEYIYLDDLYQKCFLIKVPALNKKYKIRIPITQYPHTAQYEYKVLRFFEKFNIEWIPHVYYYGKGVDDLGDILIYEYIDGISLDKFKCLSDNDAKIIVSQLEKALSDLHTISSNVFGEIDGKTYSTWYDYMFEKLLKHLHKALDNKLLSYKEYNTIIKLFLKNKQYYKQVKSALLHYDVKPANIIYNSISKKTTLIDFELTRFGDINSEFSRALVLSDKFINIKDQVIIPLLKNIYGQTYNDLINSEIFYLYSLYHLIALYNFLLDDIAYDVTSYIPKIKLLISKISDK